MNTFLTLLATFYICDAMVVDGPVDHATELRCAAAFETLKISLLTDEERRALEEIGFARGAQTREAYLRFTEWEHDNQELVELFREAAEDIALTLR